MNEIKEKIKKLKEELSNNSRTITFVKQNDNLSPSLISAVKMGLEARNNEINNQLANLSNNIIFTDHAKIRFLERQSSLKDIYKKEFEILNHKIKPLWTEGIKTLTVDNMELRFEGNIVVTII